MTRQCKSPSIHLAIFHLGSATLSQSKYTHTLDITTIKQHPPPFRVMINNRKRLNHFINTRNENKQKYREQQQKIVSKYDQVIPQSQTAYKPIAS